MHRFFLIIGFGLLNLGFALDLRLKQAEYLYELEGEKDAAINLLQKVTKSSNPNDVKRSYLGLAKIYDWSGQADSAQKYYEFFLQKPCKDPTTKQWVSNRLNLLQSQAPHFFLKSHNFSSPITSIAQNEKFVTILLNNGNLYSLDSVGLKKTPFMLKHSQQIVYANHKSFWVNNYENERILLEYDYHGKLTHNNIELDGKLLDKLELSNNRILISTAKSIYLLKNHRKVWQISNQYQGCTPISEAFSLKQVYFNCLDNAVRIVNLEDGLELETINLLNPVDSIFSTNNGLFISNNQGLLLKSPIEQPSATQWQKTFINIHSILAFDRDKLAVLESDGSLNLLNQKNGQLISRTMVEPGALFQNQGYLGLISWSGNLFLMDNQAKVFASYQSGYSPKQQPLINHQFICLQVSDKQIAVLSNQYYGKTHHHLQNSLDSMVNFHQQGKLSAAQSIADSLLQKEPGNKNAWVVKANVQGQMGSTDSALWAWSNAARFSNHHIAGYSKNLILREFAQAAQANWIQSLPSLQKSYPKILSNSKHIFSLDAEGSNLVAIDPATGSYNWRSSLQKLETDYTLGHDENLLALSSHYNAAIYDLHDKGKHIGNLDLPGKAYKIHFTTKYIYISTWNGFLMKFDKKSLQALWSRKLFTAEALIDNFNDKIVALSTKGDMIHIDDNTGATLEEININLNSITLLHSNDSLLFVLNIDGTLNTFNNKLEKIITHPFGQQVFSLQKTKHNNKVIVGLANQQIRLFDVYKKTFLWNFQGKNSIFVKPLLSDNQIFLDQGEKVIQLDLENGHLIKSWDLPGGCGSIWLHNDLLIVPSALGFLYQFTLDDRHF